MYRLFYVLLICFIQIQAIVTTIDHGNYVTIQSEYGDYKIEEPVLIDLIKSPAFERLKYIHQYGVCRFAREEKQFTRYDHSLGVFVLLRKFGASIEEQIAGLLHDVSHTVFSHVGDVLFNTYFKKYSYQDDIHEWYLKKVGIINILKSYGLETCCTVQAKKRFRMLEQDRPNLCIDRIEYLLRGGLVDNFIMQDDVHKILNDLYFENLQWVFVTKESAKKLADLGLKLSEHIFGSDWNIFIYTQASNALKHAVEIGVLNMDDIHFSTDDVVWQKMAASSDPYLIQELDKITHYKKYYTLGNQNDFDIHLKGKFLCIDPWVEIKDGTQRLREIDLEYACEFNRVKNLIERGWYFKLVN
jgi:HD superfamily phosphohydrolase